MGTAKKKTNPAGKRKRKPVDPSVLEQRRFARSIKTLFTNMGFTLIPTEGTEAKFGVKTGELDSVYVYENILLIVEDTTRKKPFEHAKNKSMLAAQILGNQKSFIEWLKDSAAEHSPLLSAYSPQRFKLFFLYFSKFDMELDDDAISLLEPMLVVPPRALNYFDKLARTIRHSARTDLWRFLQLSSNDIGSINATNDAKTIETTIISPDDSTGFINGVRLVSFMISADVLLRNSYVLRKDNWEYSTDLYQRLIDTSRIKKIRQYIASEGSAFLNNIIIGLPRDISFQAPDKSSIDLEQIQDYASYRMTIPDEFNSLCLIDGQHRVFAHYEGTDDLEPEVGAIRKKVHLLATGLIFPQDMSELDVLRLQSEIFLDINSNTKPVPADVLLAIQSLRAPFADVAVARRVLERLNRMSTFRGMFQMSQMDEAPIKIASIVKFALRYLVDIDSDGGLYSAWTAKDGERTGLRDRTRPELLSEYVDFAAGVLERYFSAFKTHHGAGWGDQESKVTSTTVINGMIIALRRSIPALGVLTFQEYADRMGSWEIDFSKTSFRFASSQYARFSTVVLDQVFDLVEIDGVWLPKG